VNPNTSLPVVLLVGIATLLLIFRNRIAEHNYRKHHPIREAFQRDDRDPVPDKNRPLDPVIHGFRALLASMFPDSVAFYRRGIISFAILILIMAVVFALW